MAYDLTNRLVIGLASSALFDLSDSDKVFREQGTQAYRHYQRQMQSMPLQKGVAFAFIEKLLSINQINPEDPPIEVILLSKNDPDTGFRVMNSIEYHNLNISRALFLEGRYPHKYINALSIDLFLSSNQDDVQKAINEGFAAGHVLKSHITDNKNDDELRVALDFDGVLADDSAEKVFADKGLDGFHEYEELHQDTAHNPGPLAHFLKKLSDIQIQEEAFASQNNDYTPKLRISIVTARGAPSHKRVIHTIRQWGVHINEAFFLGGVSKREILKALNPQIFFDDQKVHLDNTIDILPSVNIPFGIRNIDSTSINLHGDKGDDE